MTQSNEMAHDGTLHLLIQGAARRMGRYGGTFGYVDGDKTMAVERKEDGTWHLWQIHATGALSPLRPHQMKIRSSNYETAFQSERPYTGAD